MNKILIAGDIVPTESNYELFSKGSLEELVGFELAKGWDNYYARVANLEAPITDNKSPILKSGPSLSIPERCVYGFNVLGITHFALANNHIMDHGLTGLKNTLNILEGNHINHFGAGLDEISADNYTLIDLKGFKIGIYACCEHEFSYADRMCPGANAISINTTMRIHKIKNMVDYIVVLFHGGMEEYRYPTPEQQKRCRYFIEAGADFVICQHSHCIGCEEFYHQGRILYGQGNFIFDYKDNTFWNTSLLIELVVDNNRVEVQYIPICKREGGIVVDTMINETMEGFYNRSKNIPIIQDLYRKKVKEDGPVMARQLLGWNRILRGLDRFVFKNKMIEKKRRKKSASSVGIIRCETHKELVDSYLCNIEG